MHKGRQPQRTLSPRGDPVCAGTSPMSLARAARRRLLRPKIRIAGKGFREQAAQARLGRRKLRVPAAHLPGGSFGAMRRARGCARCGRRRYGSPQLYRCDLPGGPITLPSSSVAGGRTAQSLSRSRFGKPCLYGRPNISRSAWSRRSHGSCPGPGCRWRCARGMVAPPPRRSFARMRSGSRRRACRAEEDCPSAGPRKGSLARDRWRAIWRPVCRTGATVRDQAAPVRALPAVWAASCCSSSTS